ncbi:MAG: hypothetical protein ABFS16_02000 [Bacteroidota bacterium]
MKEQYKNILQIAGSGRNVGKTTFISQVILAEKDKEIIAVKITPHFHEPTPGIKKLNEGEGWKLYEETDRTTRKDTSRFLQNGAKKSYLIEFEGDFLQEAFNSLVPCLDDNKPVVIESAALINIIQPGIFVVILPDGECRNRKLEPVLQKADLIIISDGTQFQPSNKRIWFDNSWVID